MIDNFKTELIVRVARITPVTVLRIMGYKNPGIAAKKRLQCVLESPDMGLEKGGYDYRYSSKEFVRAIGIAVGMERLAIELYIDKLERRIVDELAAFKPYLWVDTHFKRNNQPVFMLSALNHQRYLHFAPGFWRYAFAHQLETAQSRVRLHMSETGGELGTWGCIQQYLFYYALAQAYILAPSGEVIGEHEGPVPNRPVPGRKMAVLTNAMQQG